MKQPSITVAEVRDVASKIGIDWSDVAFSLDDLRVGMGVELEHGLRDPQTDVTGNDLVMTGKIALAHLKEFPDYYQRLERMEREAEQYWVERERAAHGEAGERTGE